VITLKNVSRTYLLDGGASLTPVRGIDLTVGRGEFVLLVGRSGSGKTSLLNLAAGLLRPTTGRVFIKGTDIWGLTDRQLASLRAGTIGFVFQFPSLVPSLNVVENTVLPTSFASRTGKDSVRDHAAAWLGRLGLGDRMLSFPKQLSAGEQRRVVLARALMNRPEILLADEPTSDLDERTEQEIMSVLGELHAAGLTILMVSHSTGLIPDVDRTLRLEEGHLVELGPND
jgi:ABC-type lipoprotein export system ATPase subunit